MFCPQCGAQSPDGAKFCVGCGGGLAASTPVPEQPAQQPPVAPGPQQVPPPMPPPQPVPVAAAVAITPHLPKPKPSSFGRLMTAFIDSIVAGVFALPGGALLSIELTRRAALLPGNDVMLYAGGALTLVGLLWYLYYYLTRDGWGVGQSYGRRIVGHMVISEATGVPASKGASFVRHVVMLLLNSAGLGIIEVAMVLFRSDGRRLGDLAAKTRVVRVADYGQAPADGAAPGPPPPGGKGVAWAIFSFALIVGMASGALAAYGIWDAAEQARITLPVDEIVADVTEDAPAEVEDPAETPETRARSVVEAYYDALIAEDYDRAVGYLGGEYEGIDAEMLATGDAFVTGYEILSTTVYADGTVEVEMVEVLTGYDGTLAQWTVTHTVGSGADGLIVASFYPGRDMDTPLSFADPYDVIDAFYQALIFEDYATAETLADFGLWSAWAAEGYPSSATDGYTVIGYSTLGESTVDGFLGIEVEHIEAPRGGGDELPFVSIWLLGEDEAGWYLAGFELPVG